MQINIEKRYAFMIIGAIMIATIVGIVYAGVDGVSHSADELDLGDVCMSDGSNCPDAEAPRIRVYHGQQNYAKNLGIHDSCVVSYYDGNAGTCGVYISGGKHYLKWTGDVLDCYATCFRW